MENILLRFFREIYQHTPESVAGYLDISPGEYKDIETGEILLTVKQARQLGKLYNIKGDYFYDAALQLDLLLAKIEISKIQKTKIQQMLQQLHQLQGHTASHEKKNDNDAAFAIP